MQPPILTRQEATLWLKVSAHSTLVMNSNSQIGYIPICRLSDSQPGGHYKTEETACAFADNAYSIQKQMFDIAHQHNKM